MTYSHIFHLVYVRIFSHAERLFIPASHPVSSARATGSAADGSRLSRGKSERAPVLVVDDDPRMVRFVRRSPARRARDAVRTVPGPARLRSRCVGAPGQVVEELQAAPGVAAAPAPFGEPGPVGAGK